ncbi:MAG: prolipoprotein diacylglyceryl transferase [Butyrivibrio sp.]
MYPIIDFFGINIHTYSLMAFLGLTAAVIYCLTACRHNGIDLENEICMLATALLFLFVFAVLLYWITRIPDIIRLFPYIFTDFKYFAGSIGFGLVFYGGLFGAFTGCIIYGKLLHMDIRPMVKVSVPAVPLFHIFGRLGCFFAGCCHGIENQHFGIVINNIPYLPVQLYEAFGNLVIFMILLFRRNFAKSCYEAIGIYGVTYGVMRFLLEFLRGDTVRGHLGIFSTSQWISLFLIALGIYCLIRPENKNFLNRFFTLQKSRINI